MATAYRVGPDNDIALRFERGSFDPGTQRLALQAGPRVYRIDVNAVGEDGWLRIDDGAFAVERALVAHRDEPLELVVTDLSRARRLAAEPLHFHQSFFVPLVDFAALALPGIEPRSDLRPGLLAACTHVYNDAAFLRVWERHYARFVPREQLYVIDHGSTPPAAEVLSPGTQCIRLPRGLTDPANIARFCNHFQRFLLTQYRWVIHVDVDELLVPEDGYAGLLERLAADPGPPRIVEPAYAMDLVGHPVTEGPLELDRPLTAQRRFLVPNAEYRKPALVSRPATWGPGFHYAVEAFAVVEDPRLWLVHLAQADVALTAARNRTWLETLSSRPDRATVDHGQRSTDPERLRAATLQRLGSERVQTVPGWMLGMF